MLIRLRAAFIAAVLLLGLTICAPVAHADPPKCKTYNALGVCLIWVTLPPGPPPPSEPAGIDPQPVVKPQEGTLPNGIQPIVVDGKQCFPSGKRNPQPDFSDPVWEGHINGAIYDCLAGPAGVQGAVLTLQYWAAVAPKVAPPPDPRLLAQQAVVAMNLRAVTIGVVPEPKAGSVGLVGLPNWMWVQEPSPGTYGPITRAASVGGYTVAATARVDRVVWDMGDGPVITCGKGTPYEDRFAKRKSPTCGHVYTRQGRYPVTATSYWVIEWSGIGQAGTINLDLTQQTSLTIGEAQVISQ